MRNLCIIPVKGNSTRLANKNVREFFGRLLFTYSLDHAKDCGLFDTIHISTSSESVAEVSKEHGFDIDFKRPDILSQDGATLYEVCDFVLKGYAERGQDFDQFCMLWPTSPLRTPEDLQKAYSLLLEQEANGVVGVCEYNLPVQCAQELTENGSLEPVFENQDFWKRSDKRIVCDNGSFCWVRTDAFKEHKTWLPPKTYGYEMPRSRSIDVDTQEDWEMMEYFYRKQHEQKP